MDIGAERKDAPRRSAGILLHPTSLPGRFGIGELGPEAFEFVRFLEEAGQKLWQVLPLGPTGVGNSPYASSSAFAGNPLLVSTERLIRDGLIEGSLLPSGAAPGRVDYPAVISGKTRKTKRLREAHGKAKPGEDFEKFREENRFWLENYALFMALKEKFGGKPWSRWPEELSHREPGALERARAELSEEVGFHEFVQHRFFRDWGDVRRAANEAGVEVIGDIPIFVSHDSADVWANQELFHLDESGDPSVVAGVPPDYFSDTGQLWGNPLYDWEKVREDKDDPAGRPYGWWVERMRQALNLYDSVRIDHFRGFQAYWEIPADETTAKNGRWVEGPGEEIFEALRESLGDPPIIAEDLGEITPDVEELRDGLGLPGMKVLQFAFSGPDNPHLPHNYRGGNWVAYTGTHDNDTTVGWWNSATSEERRFARRYLGREYATVWDFVRLAYSSVAERAVVPMQDALALGSDSRMNRPGHENGNWEWRMDSGEPTPGLAGKLRELAEAYGR